MRILQLKYFLAVCQYKSFTLAAKKFYVSQPAVSAAIRDLEERHGIRLFDRKKATLELTEEGLWLQERASFIVRYIEATEEQLEMFSQNKKYLRIGVAPMIGMLSFFPIFHNFSKDIPDIHVDLLEAGSLQIRQWVVDGVADIGVLLIDDLPRDSFETLDLFDTELIFCVNESHPLAHRESVSFEDLSNQKIILLKEDSYQNKLIRDKFHEHGSSINVLTYSSQISSMLNMLSYGNCGAFLFRQLVEDRDDVRIISLDSKITLTAGLAWKKNQIIYPPMLRLINYVKKNRLAPHLKE